MNEEQLYPGTEKKKDFPTKIYEHRRALLLITLVSVGGFYGSLGLIYVIVRVDREYKLYLEEQRLCRLANSTENATITDKTSETSTWMECNTINNRTVCTPHTVTDYYIFYYSNTRGEWFRKSISWKTWAGVEPHKTQVHIIYDCKQRVMEWNIIDEMIVR